MAAACTLAISAISLASVHQPLVFVLVDLRGPGHEGPQHVALELVRMHPQLGQGRGDLRRMDRARGQRPGLAELGRGRP